MRFLAPVICLALFLASCSSSPKDLIVGEWEFDHVEPLEADKNNPNMTATVVSVNNSFHGVTTEFKEDGSCLSTFPFQPGPIKGIYSLADNNATLITSYETNPKENPSKIIKLTSSELVLETDNLLYFMKK